MKKLRITVDGRVFDVTVEQAEDSAPVASRPAAPLVPVTSVPTAPTPPLAAVSAPAGAVVSPLAGKVVSVDVQVGATVAVGTQLATIEAMKMNTFIYAERPGKVTGILVKSGDAVEEGGAILSLG